MFFCYNGVKGRVIFSALLYKYFIFQSFFVLSLHFTKNEVIFITLDFEQMESEYISSKLTYAELAEKYNAPVHLIARYAKNNQWVNKRRLFSKNSQSNMLDVSKLARSSKALESIIESAFISVSENPNADSIDTKTLKELTSTLKEAINIKQNIFLLPMLTEQKQLELEQKKAPISTEESEIRVILENDADKFCV